MQDKNIDNYTLGKTIGEGTFGRVKLGVHKLSGEKVAIKILEKEKIQDESDVVRVAKEIEILKKLRHTNIILLFEIIETDKELFLIMEYANGGELFEYIVSHQRVKEQQACKFLLQILSGVEYIHKIGVVHRDLKPENLLLDHNNNIKIVDFGLSNTYKQGELLKTACGSPCYAAPEMVQGKRYNGYMVDIWSCGIILFALICGYLPFEDPNTNQLYKKIIAGDFNIPKFVSTECRDLLMRILNTDPSKRYTISQIRNHVWCKQVQKYDDFVGIIVGLDSIPVDEGIIEQLKLQYNIDPTVCRRYIQKNRHNNITTLYFLQLQKNRSNNRNKTYYVKKDDKQEEVQFGKDSKVNTTVLISSRKRTEPNNEIKSIPQRSPNQRIDSIQQTSNRKSESPQLIHIPLKREEIRKQPIRTNIPPGKLKMRPIQQAVNNSISSAGTNTNQSTTPIGSNRRTEESLSVEKIKQKVVVRDRAISAISQYNEKPIVKIHKGAFNFKCTSSKHPDLLVDDIKKALALMNLRYSLKSKYELQCQANQNIRFEIAIRQLQNCEQIYLVKGTHLSGDFGIYQQNIQKLMNSLIF